MRMFCFAGEHEVLPKSRHRGNVHQVGDTVQQDDEHVDQWRRKTSKSREKEDHEAWTASSSCFSSVVVVVVVVVLVAVVVVVVGSVVVVVVWLCGGWVCGRSGSGGGVVVVVVCCVVLFRICTTGARSTYCSSVPLHPRLPANDLRQKCWPAPAGILLKQLEDLRLGRWGLPEPGRAVRLVLPPPWSWCLWSVPVERRTWCSTVARTVRSVSCSWRQCMRNQRSCRRFAAPARVRPRSHQKKGNANLSEPCGGCGGSHGSRGGVCGGGCAVVLFVVEAVVAAVAVAVVVVTSGSGCGGD